MKEGVFYNERAQRKISVFTTHHRSIITILIITIDIGTKVNYIANLRTHVYTFSVCAYNKENIKIIAKETLEPLKSSSCLFVALRFSAYFCFPFSL